MGEEYTNARCNRRAILALMKQQLPMRLMAEKLGVRRDTLRKAMKRHDLAYPPEVLREIRRKASLDSRRKPGGAAARVALTDKGIEDAGRKFRRDATEGSAQLLARILATGTTHGPLR